MEDLCAESVWQRVSSECASYLYLCVIYHGDRSHTGWMNNLSRGRLSSSNNVKHRNNSHM